MRRRAASSAFFSHPHVLVHLNGETSQIFSEGRLELGLGLGLGLSPKSAISKIQLHASPSLYSRIVSELCDGGILTSVKRCL